jgi:hypothetical protein
MDGMTRITYVWRCVRDKKESINQQPYVGTFSEILDSTRPFARSLTVRWDACEF